MRRGRLPALLAAMTIAVALSPTYCRAGIPRILRHIPEELHGDYVLIARTQGDRVDDRSEKPLPFGSVELKQIALGTGLLLPVKHGVRVSQKGETAYLLNFEVTVLLGTGGSPGVVELTEEIPGERRGETSRRVHVLTRVEGAPPHEEPPEGDRIPQEYCGSYLLGPRVPTEPEGGEETRPGVRIEPTRIVLAPGIELKIEGAKETGEAEGATHRLVLEAGWVVTIDEAPPGLGVVQKGADGQSTIFVLRSVEAAAPEATEAPGERPQP